MDRDFTMCGVLCIGPANAEQATGQPWRWWRDHATQLGLPVLHIGGKSMIRAADVARVLDRLADEAAAAKPPREPTEDEELDALAADLGFVRIRSSAAKRV